MNDHAGASSADRRDDFLRYLAERTETIGRRVDRFLRSGWDINGISVLRAETLRLAQASVRYDVQEVQLPLEKLAESLELALTQETLPDVELGGRVCELVQLLVDFRTWPLPGSDARRTIIASDRPARNSITM